MKESLGEQVSEQSWSGEKPANILRKYRWAFMGVALASALVNILYLTGSFFMLQVYDRVIPSKSVPTLVALGLLALMLFAAQGVFEALRSRVLVRIAGAMDEAINGRMFRIMLQAPMRSAKVGDGLQPLRDVDQIRTFLSGMGPPALFDLPWIPFYVAICFMFHYVIGLIAVFGVVVLIGLTFLTNFATRKRNVMINIASGMRNAQALTAQRNAEVVRSMGMIRRLSDLWETRNEAYRDLLLGGSDAGNAYASISKIFRMALQSGVLAAGAVLVIEGMATSGIIIAGSILTARALAPVEQAIVQWKAFVSARDSWDRIKKTFDAADSEKPPFQLPAPKERLVVESLAGRAPTTERTLFSDVSFTLEAGSALGVIGASGSGKSSFARCLLQLWPATNGTVRLDGSELSHWDSDDLGRYIGYLPQDVELFGGTIADNISRFDKAARAEDIIAAAQAARVHKLITDLPKGYDTEIGEGGVMLSAGQRQRIALARALYGDPFLIVLDEPNSNLDAEGEKALSAAILSVRERDGIVIVIAHRPSVLSSVDYVLLMNGGKPEAFGERDRVLGTLLARQERKLKVVVDTGKVSASAEQAGLAG